MLRNSEKITTPISSSTNQWPQNQKLDDQRGFMASSSVNNKAMAEKTNSQDPLKCPRCDSSNTKFCYYNNYSLSQPRHFCKACKRYWTRGGTLRNVPVGGGCRKNKRVKRHHSAGGGDGVSISSAASTNPSSVNQPQIDLSSATKHINNPMFYNSLELNFPFSSFRVSSESTRFDDLQPQMSNLGLGFSSSGQNIQDVFGGSVNDALLFGSSAFGSTSTMASLLASSFQQQKFSNSLKDIQAANIPGLMPYEDSGPGNRAPDKEVKIEGNRMVWNPNPNPDPIDNNSSDPSSLLWNTNNVGAWFDPSNMGSSVPSLI